MKKHLGWLIALGFCAGSTFAATMTAGYTMGAGSQLLMDNGGSGTNLFVDFAALGGSDLRDPDGMNDTYTVLIDGAGHWRIGDTVELTGFAIPIHQVTGNGTMTLEILQGSGGSGATGAGGLATIGTVTAAYTNGGIVTSTHYVNFDTPVSFVADTNTLKIGINIANSSNIALKHNATHNVIRYNRVNGDLMPTKMQVSLAGNVIASGTTSNSAPEFVSDPFSMTAGFEDIFYTASLLDFVSDPDNDALTLSLLSFSGPGTDWLGVDGTSVTGTPQLADVGVNEWLVQAVDGNGGTNTASMTIEVLPESGFMMGGYTIGSGLLSPHGEILFVDTADAGGANLNDADGATPPYFSVLIPGDGLWTTGDTVRITGLALHLDGFTGNGVMAFEIRQGSGGTGASKAGGLDAIETTYAPYLNSGSNDTMYVNFAQPVEFVADANTLSIGIHISHSTNIRMKEDDGFPVARYNYANGNIVAASGMKVSVAGTVNGTAPSAYDTWAAGYGVTNGLADDHDGDGLENLLEYALNGDPTNGFADTEAPFFGSGSGGLNYVYAQRTDDDALSYFLEVTDSLTYPTWTNTGYTVEGTNITGETFDYVTNTLPTADDAAFIRLIINRN